jgi:branched-chain amino acid transport system ATP-binding protein
MSQTGDTRGTAPVLLRLSNVEVVYDKVFLAIKGVSLEIREGDMVALLGANGAGKSTTLKSVSGLLAPERGEVTRGHIEFAGRDLGTMPAPQRVHLGIAHVLEGRRVFGHLTPEENLIAAYRGRDQRRYLQLRDMVYGYFPRLVERAKSKAGYLSGGEQQMLAIGRALMTEPKLLMLDEPSLGLSPLFVKEIFGIIRTINEKERMSVLLVEQNAVAALNVVQHAYVVDQGRIVMEGGAALLRQNPDIQEFYLGGSHAVDYHNVKHYRRRKRWLA